MTRMLSYLAICLLLLENAIGFAQGSTHPQTLYFLSDCQAPLWIEKIVGKPYRNEEARDSLFADIIRRNPRQLFLLGDMEAWGADARTWVPLDTFMARLKKTGTSVYAIPGNHEYMGGPEGAALFLQRFEKASMKEYLTVRDSLAVIMLNTNWTRMQPEEISRQRLWFRKVLDSLDAIASVKAVIVCTHQPPFSNSKVVGSSIPVQTMLVPEFETSRKTRLFISGHSHNLEYFAGRSGKRFLVIGGGGGIDQPLIQENARIHYDLLNQDEKPRFFYVVIERKGKLLNILARGFKKDFSFFEFQVGSIPME